MSYESPPGRTLYSPLGGRVKGSRVLGFLEFMVLGCVGFKAFRVSGFKGFLVFRGHN
jgi:hypothetical protein